MKSFIKLINDLQIIISEKLPGEEAQYKMAPLKRGKMVEFKEKIPTARIGAVCIHLYPYNDAINTLLTVRQENLKSHAGQVSFPGGKVENIDVDEYAASLREFEEETGIPSKNLKLIGPLSPLYIPASNFLVKPFVTYSEMPFSAQPDSNEVKELLYFNIIDLLNESLKGEVEVQLFTGVKTNVPCYYIHKNAVWGATAMILSEFEAILKSIQLQK